MGRKLYVGNLPYRFDDAALQALFADAGEVVSASIVKDHETGRGRGFGFVEMASDEAAHKAISVLHQRDVEGRALVVNEARPRERRGPGAPPPGRGFPSAERSRGFSPGGPRRPGEGGEGRRFGAEIPEPAPFELPDRNFGERGSRRSFDDKRGRDRKRDESGRGEGRRGRGRRDRGGSDDEY